jgi:hypothetical protein
MRAGPRQRRWAGRSGEGHQRPRQGGAGGSGRAVQVWHVGHAPWQVARHPATAPCPTRLPVMWFGWGSAWAWAHAVGSGGCFGAALGLPPRSFPPALSPRSLPRCSGLSPPFPHAIAPGRRSRRRRARAGGGGTGRSAAGGGVPRARRLQAGVGGKGVDRRGVAARRSSSPDGSASHGVWLGGERPASEAPASSARTRQPASEPRPTLLPPPSPHPNPSPRLAPRAPMHEGRPGPTCGRGSRDEGAGRNQQTVNGGAAGHGCSAGRLVRLARVAWGLMRLAIESRWKGDLRLRSGLTRVRGSRVSDAALTSPAHVPRAWRGQPPAPGPPRSAPPRASVLCLGRQPAPGAAAGHARAGGRGALLAGWWWQPCRQACTGRHWEHTLGHRQAGAPG